MENKTATIYSLYLAGWLLSHGHKLFNVGYQVKNPLLKCYFFKNSSELQESVDNFANRDLQPTKKENKRQIDKVKYKCFTVFEPVIAGHMMMDGFVLLGTNISKNDPAKKVYFFRGSPDFLHKYREIEGKFLMEEL